MKLEERLASGADSSHETMLVVSTHGLLLAVLFWFVAFLVPSMTVLQSFGSSPPKAYFRIMNVSNFLKANFLWVAPFFPLLLWSDALAYRAIRRRGKMPAFIWANGVTLVLLTAMVLSIRAATSALRM